MAYRLKRSDASVERGVRRIARTHIRNAIAAIDDDSMALDRRVHDVRTRCKKLCGLLRLVRPVFPAYRAENRDFRGIAKRLAGLREAAVMVDTCDDLRKAAGKGDHLADLDALRQVLTDREVMARDGHEHADLLAASRASMLAALARVEGWRLTADGFESIEGGLGKTYRQSVKAFANAWEVRSGKAFHDWRTRVKAHGYQTLLLHPIRPRGWPSMRRRSASSANCSASTTTLRSCNGHCEPGRFHVRSRRSTRSSKIAAPFSNGRR